MSFRRISIGTALFVGAAVILASVGASFAAPNFATVTAGHPPAQVIGVLTTGGNKPITVNGASVRSGASVASGATIETPTDAGATLRIAGLGQICIGHDTKLNVQFDAAGGIRITLIQGCVILRTLKGTAGVINTSQGVAGQIDPANGGSLDACISPSGAVQVGQGAASAAGVGARVLDCGTPAGAAAVPGMATSTKVAIIGGITAAALTPLLFRGSNPSPSVP